MKSLSEIYNGAPDVKIKDVKINSKQVTPGDIFICTGGVTADRHLFIDDAVKNGAAAVVVSREVKDPGVPVIKVDDTNKELFHLAGEVYSYPQNELSLIGVTGTNGKTSVAEMIYAFLGDKSSYLGTNGKKYKGKCEHVRNTTPDVDRSYKYFREYVDSGCTSCVIEISSEAMLRHRLDDVSLDACVLTNITEDHLDKHGSLDNYIECKANAFTLVKDNGFTVLNSGSKYFDRVKEKAKGKILTYGFKNTDDIYITECRLNGKLSFDFVYDNKMYTVNTRLRGDFNALNLIASFLVCVNYGMSIEELIKKAEELSPIEGRFEYLDFGQDFDIVLDYAHTEDALIKVLDELLRTKKGRIIAVTGAAGGREKEKRPRMGTAVLKRADFAFFTEENSRNEATLDIINQLLLNCEDFSNYKIIPKRKEAIAAALSFAQKDDTVLIAGKGRDTYMAVGEGYLYYCDYDVIEEFFK